MILINYFTFVASFRPLCPLWRTNTLTFNDILNKANSFEFKNL